MNQSGWLIQDDLIYQRVIDANEVRIPFEEEDLPICRYQDSKIPSEQFRFYVDHKKQTHRPPSTCAMKRLDALSILKKTYTLEKHFRVCADEVLVYGTSLMGWKTTLLKDETVNYRVHSGNHFFESTANRDKSEEKKRREALFHHFQKMENFSYRPKDIYLEMRMNNSAALQKKYRKIIRNLPAPKLMCLYWRWRFRQWKELK